MSWLIRSLCPAIPRLEGRRAHHLEPCNHARMPGTAQLKALNGVILNLIGNKPDRVGSSLNCIRLDLELNDSEIMEDISARNVENHRRVDRDSEDICVCVVVRISENPIELVTRDIESRTALSRDLSLIVGRNAVTPSSIWRAVREERVHRGK